MSKPLAADAPETAGIRSFWREERSQHLAVLLVLAVVFAIAPLFVYPMFVMKVMCFALFAAAFNLLLGYGGLVSFGHAAYFGSAAYIAGYALKYWGVTPELAILLAVAGSALLGFVFGAVAIRRQGIYFAMITLAMAQVVYFFSVRAPGFTGGEDGIQAIPRGALFGLVDLSNPVAVYGFVFAVFVGGMFVVYRVIHSPFGKTCMAIRENEQRAISLGIDTNRHKLLMFVISAALAGLAGSTKIVVFQLASLVDVHWSMSGEAVLMTLVGGLGTFSGPVFGAAIIVTLGTYLAEFGAWIMLIQGLIFIASVMVFREGVAGMLARLLRARL